MVAIGVAALGLILALKGDGWWNVISALLFSIPVAAALLFTRKRRKAPRHPF